MSLEDQEKLAQVVHLEQCLAHKISKCQSFPLLPHQKASSGRAEILTVLLAANSPVPTTVPGMPQALSQGLLNK